jgi:hypothetical protein
MARVYRFDGKYNKALNFFVAQSVFHDVKSPKPILTLLESLPESVVPTMN